MNLNKLGFEFLATVLVLFSACGSTSDDATLKATSTVKGVTVTDLGTPNAVLAYTVDGSVTIEAEADGATLFAATNADATVKVVKYAAGDSITNFDFDTAYANEAITDQDFFIIKVTAEDGETILYYNVVVTVTQAPEPSNIATVTSSIYTVSAGGIANETIIDVDKGVNKTDFLAALTMGENHQAWDSTGINDTVADGDTLVVTAQDGTTTVTYTIAVPTKAIGEAYLNGKVGYVLKSADSGYVLGETHGLIAATADHGAPTIVPWISDLDGSIWSELNGNTLTAVGTGLANTDAMRNQPGYSTGVQNNAASVCYAYTTGDDLHSWYLPSLDELHKLYLNKVAIGGFVIVSNLYWSSSEYNQWSGICVDFSDGTNDGLTKGTGSYVRCVKTF